MLFTTPCDVCSKTDDAPKHVVVIAWPDLVQRRHMDCCAGVGCIDGTCNVILALAVDETGTVAKNDNLRDVVLDPRRESPHVL